MTLNTINQRRKYTAITTTIIMGILLVIFFIINTYTTIQKLEISKLDDENARFKGLISKTEKELANYNIPIAKMNMFKWFEPLKFKSELQSRLNQYVLDNGQKKYGFAPFNIKVDSIEISPKYFNLINIKLTYADVDWIFGFDGGFKMANEMLLDILKQDSIISHDIGKIILTPKEDEPSIYITLKIVSKKAD